MGEKKNEELKENFDYFDRDGDGKIDFGEFSELMDALGAELKAEEARLGFASIDEDGSGHIDFVEFCTWWLDR